MKNMVFGLMVVFGFNVALADSKEHFKLIGVKDVITLKIQKASKLAIFDANNDETRKANGVIPGATLLTSYKDYDVAKVLPAAKDTTLVFYCGDVKCMSSHKAAERAYEAGYKDVNVMADGIKGWISSGHPVQAMK
jgi:rhodanese-related sulfurtransferase